MQQVPDKCPGYLKTKSIPMQSHPAFLYVTAIRIPICNNNCFITFFTCYTVATDASIHQRLLHVFSHLRSWSLQSNLVSTVLQNTIQCNFSTYVLFFKFSLAPLNISPHQTLPSKSLKHAVPSYLLSRGAQIRQLLSQCLIQRWNETQDLFCSSRCSFDWNMAPNFSFVPAYPATLQKLPPLSYIINYEV